MTAKLDGTNGVTFPDGTTQGTAAVSIGIGQTWQIYSRTAATDYQNTTGRSIQVNVVVNGGDYASASFYVGVTTGSYVLVGYSYQVGAGTNQTISFIVPPNNYYKVTLSGDAIYSWTELR